MFFRANPAFAKPHSANAVRKPIERRSPWIRGGTALVVIAALLFLAPFYLSANPLADNTQTNFPNATGELELNRVIERLQDAPRLIQLNGINRYFNDFRYLSDLENWKHPDYWATPMEFLARRTGDCEDFAIAKYFALRALGVPDDQMFIAYVYDVSIDSSHMILIYRRPGAPDLVLDNRMSLILSLREHKNLVPVYGFNATGAFLLPASAQTWNVAHRPVSYLHPQWTKILGKVPDGSPARRRAGAPIPAALRVPGGFTLRPDILVPRGATPLPD